MDEKEQCTLCHDERKVCYSARRDSRTGGTTQSWISTRHCPEGGSGTPHRHMLVDCPRCRGDNG